MSLELELGYVFAIGNPKIGKAARDRNRSNP
jgi:hypothetical protein